MEYPVSGTPFHGQFESADARALAESASRFLLYAAGRATALTLAIGDRLVITDVEVWSNASGSNLVRVYDGANNSIAAGEYIFVANNTSVSTTGCNYWSHAFGTPHWCPAAVDSTGTDGAAYPKVITSAAVQTDVIIRGVIVTAAT